MNLRCIIIISEKIFRTRRELYRNDIVKNETVFIVAGALATGADQTDRHWQTTAVDRRCIIDGDEGKHPRKHITRRPAAICCVWAVYHADPNLFTRLRRVATFTW